MAPGIVRDVTKSTLICIIGIMIQCRRIRRIQRPVRSFTFLKGV